MRMIRSLAAFAMFALSGVPALAQTATPSAAPPPDIIARPVVTAGPSQPVPTGSPSARAVLIENSGSTNTLAYTIALEPSGVAFLKSSGTTVARQLDAKIVARFFTALTTVGPLEKIIVQPCAKSASFGTYTTVTAAGKSSPDISCGGDAKTAELAAAADAVAIAARAGRPTYRRLLDTNAAPMPSPTGR